MTKTENTNCLAGWKCPECDSIGPFKVEAVHYSTVYLHDDGTEDAGEGGSTEWDDQSGCECPECGYSGVVPDFTGEAIVEKHAYQGVIVKKDGEVETFVLWTSLVLTRETLEEFQTAVASASNVSYDRENDTVYITHVDKTNIIEYKLDGEA